MAKTKTVTVTGFVFMEKDYATNPDGTKDYYSPQVWVPSVWKCKVDDGPERVFVGTQSISVEVPADFDPRPQLVAALEEEKRQASAAYQKLVTDINRRISELQAIEYTPEAA